MTENRAEYVVIVAKPSVADENERLLGQLITELFELLSGNENFRIEIHGKPGARFRYSVTRFVD